jgi:hypothetical protein
MIIFSDRSNYNHTLTAVFSSCLFCIHFQSHDKKEAIVVDVWNSSGCSTLTLKYDIFKGKFWEELICLLSLHKLTVNNIQCHHLHSKFHPNPPIDSKVAPISEV